MPETTNLYEELGITNEATVEEVRKAYKKKALQTHPDRLPQGATADDKAASEEKFRRVNNAYEVLSDPTKRKAYDTFGVWPPPEEDEALPSHSWSSRPRHSSFHSRGPYRSQTFPDPFFSSHFHNTFQFTDPFALFDEIFQGTPFSRTPRHHHNSTSSRSPFDGFGSFDRVQTDIDDFMDDLDRDPFTRGFPSQGFMHSMPPVTRITTTSFGNGGGGSHFISESYSSSTINGVQQSVHKRVDAEGNEHITRTYPDGRQIRTINGVEQSSRGQISSHGHVHGHGHSQSRQLPARSGHHYHHHAPAAPPPQAVRISISPSSASSSTSRSGFMPPSSMEPPPYSKATSPISPRGYDSSGPRDSRSHSHVHHHHPHPHHRLNHNLHRHRSVNSTTSGGDKYDYAPDPTDVPQRKQNSRWWHMGRQ